MTRITMLIKLIELVFDLMFDIALTRILTFISISVLEVAIHYSMLIAYTVFKRVKSKFEFLEK